MSLRPTDTARTSGDGSASAVAADRDAADVTARENKRKDGTHPSLRALPDYPAR